MNKLNICNGSLMPAIMIAGAELPSAYNYGDQTENLSDYDLSFDIEKEEVVITFRNNPWLAISVVDLTVTKL